MSRSYYGDNPDNIRRALLNGTVKATDAKARFVGREAYVGAGGRIERDLFGEDVDESWIDVELIEQLAAQKLEAAAEALAAEQKLAFVTPVLATHVRSEEHTSELQSLMRISYAVFCLKKKKNTKYT